MVVRKSPLRVVEVDEAPDVVKVLTLAEAIESGDGHDGVDSCGRAVLGDGRGVR